MERTGHTLSKGGLSRSSPSLAAAFSLRQYSLERKHIGFERTPSSPEIVLQRIDLVGGNGRWRQRKAKEEWARREVEELERQRQEKLKEEARRRHRAEMEAKRRRQQEEEEQRRREERERHKREEIEREEKQRAEEEAERVRREEEEKEWLAKQPKTCEACGGVGKCPQCAGKGHLFSMFLVPSVSQKSLRDFGRMMQGCEACGGCKQNVVGELKKGNGQCAACGGVGKIAPQVTTQSNSRRRFGQSMGPGSESPKSMVGSPKAYGSAAAAWPAASP